MILYWRWFFGLHQLLLTMFGHCFKVMLICSVLCLSVCLSVCLFVYCSAYGRNKRVHISHPSTSDVRDTIKCSIASNRRSTRTVQRGYPDDDRLPVGCAKGGSKFWKCGVFRGNVNFTRKSRWRRRLLACPVQWIKTVQWLLLMTQKCRSTSCLILTSIVAISQRAVRPVMRNFAVWDWQRFLHFAHFVLQ